MGYGHANIFIWLSCEAVVGQLHVNDLRFICRGVAFSVHFHSFSASVRYTQYDHMSNIQPSEGMLCVKIMSFCVTVTVS